MQKIIILNFGSQTTQLIGRRVRELNTFCEVLPYDKFPADDPDVIGVILSGSPLSVYDPEAFHPDLSAIVGRYPVLGICYGAQLLSHQYGGRVESAGTREYGRARLESLEEGNPLFVGIHAGTTVWMSHGDSITAIPEGCRTIASTASVKNAAFQSGKNKVWGVQFHPEVYHTDQGLQLLKNFVVGICGIVFLVGMFQNGGLAFFNDMNLVLNTFMVAVSLAVAAIPEGLVAVVTIALSIGVTKMSKRNAIVRKMNAVETLGCTQVICSDKTGTLTQNKMTVVEHAGGDENLLMTAMALCSDAELEEGEAVGEATECALVNDANRNGLSKPQLKEQLPRVNEAPFDSIRKRMSTIHEASKEVIPAAFAGAAGKGTCYLQFTKGAPDEVLNCSTKILKEGKIIPLTEEQRSEILAEYKGMADRALRVLGAAAKLHEQAPSTDKPLELEQDLVWIGMCGMIDPIRPEVKAAIEKCRSAGIRPIMITGDHKDTAVAIAKELGILKEGQMAVTGAELDAIPDEVFAHDVRKYSVYARVQPENKVRIVDAWQALGCITAMTGDGVNDAPAIKSADIGVGMGITGTDVTKSVADMILTDDNFATIVSAVAEGRRIYDNIRKAIQFLLSANLAEVLAVFISTLLGFTIFRPVHILWINLITDTFPAISLGMEEAESDTMNRPPRSPKESIFAGGLGFDVILEGCIISALTILSYFTGYRIENGVWGIGQSPAGMTMAFLTLSMMEIFHSFNLRSRRRSLFTLPHQNKWLWGTLVFSTAITAAVVFIPALRNVFSFAPVSLKDYGLAMLIAVSIIPIMEIVKFFSRLASK